MIEKNPKERINYTNWFFFLIGNDTSISNKVKYKEKWMSDPQRLYKKGLQSLIKREKEILLTSLH